MSTTAPTQEQLAALQPGESIRHGWMSVTRPADDPLRDPRRTGLDALYFKKRYLEETVTYCAPRELVTDMLPDPWEVVSDELDRFAAERGMHSREDGSLVVAPW